MRPPAQHAPRHTGLLLAALFAIPFVSVTIAARLGDVASSTDPSDAVAGGAALLFGVGAGLVVQRLVVSVDTRVRGVVRFIAATQQPLPDLITETVRVAGRLADEATMPRLAFVPAETGRRGPPIHVR